MIKPFLQRKSTAGAFLTVLVASTLYLTGACSLDGKKFDQEKWSDLSRKGMDAGAAEDWQTAERWHLEALKETANQEPPGPETADTLVNLAQVYEKSGQLESAILFYRQAADLRRKLNENPDKLAPVFESQIRVLKKLNRYKEAESVERHLSDLKSTATP